MKSTLIIALDVDSPADATRLVELLAGPGVMFKVGSQLFTRTGPRIVEQVQQRGAKVFLDLKFHDIPNTVAKAVEAAVSLGVDMLTVHTVGGAEMLQAAAQAAAGRCKVVGVTVLTSVGGNVADEVLRRAKLAEECGLQGVVASAHELAGLRAVLRRDMVIVTPGIRPAGAAVGDQKRVMTPREAVAAGADYLVVGRPIVAAPDPVAAARQVLAEMAG